jgi:urea transport system substrate-binding protein
VVYVGGGPNQQMIPTTSWMVGQGKRKFFLVGSDSIFSTAGNAIMRDQLEKKKVEWAREEYVPLLKVASPEFSRIAQRIKESGADAVINTVDGHEANVNFFHALSENGVKATELMIVSFAFMETELQSLNASDSVGLYAAANYFESMQNPENLEFLKRFKARYPNRAVNDPVAASYTAVYLWKQAVIEAGTEQTPPVRAAMAHQQYAGPEGVLAIDEKTHYAKRTARIGRVVINRDHNREFDIVDQSPKPMPTIPFPDTRTRPQWDEFLLKLYQSWGEHWSKQ